MQNSNRRPSGGLAPPLSGSDTPGVIRDSLVTLRNAKRLDDKEDATASKLAHILHTLAEEIDTRMITATVNKIKSEIKAVAYVIDSLISRLPTPRTPSNNDQVTKDLSERLDKTTEIIQTLSNKIESLTATTKNISSSVETIPAAVEKNATAYRDALLANPAPTQRQNAPSTEEEARILARYEVLARQLLFDFPLDSTADLRPNQTTIKELTMKAVKATTPPEDLDYSIKALTTLNNGGILLEFATPEAVNWICDNVDKKQTFESTFGHNITVKIRTYPLLIFTVPIHLELDSDTLLRELEETNDAPEGSFIRMNWVKPPHKRHPQQTIGYARLLVNSRDLINRFSTRGILVAGKRLEAKRDTREAMKCTNCQKWRHMKKDCQNEQRCANCGENHSSDNCFTDKVYCISCDSNDHASWSRNCPVFKAECKRLEERRPYDTTPFYYSPKDPWTHPVPKSTSPRAPAPFPMQMTEHNPPTFRGPNSQSQRTELWGSTPTQSGWGNRNDTQHTYRSQPHSNSQSNYTWGRPNANASAETHKRFEQHAWRPTQPLQQPAK
jgi:hypothetical protein